MCISIHPLVQLIPLRVEVGSIPSQHAPGRRQRLERVLKGVGSRKDPTTCWVQGHSVSTSEPLGCFVEESLGMNGDVSNYQLCLSRVCQVSGESESCSSTTMFCISLVLNLSKMFLQLRGTFLTINNQGRQITRASNRLVIRCVQHH